VLASRNPFIKCKTDFEINPERLWLFAEYQAELHVDEGIADAGIHLSPEVIVILGKESRCK
jgi:hypothetical protein